jgi:RNA polymerase sigma-70 factor (ECF subfamily)
VNRSRTNSFAGFVHRLGTGEDAAAREVFQRYTCRLLGLARRRLGALLRHRVDPEDVVQSAYKSFFRRAGAGKLEVGDWDGLWGLLALITLRKCADRAAYHTAECRDATREVVGIGEGGVYWEAASREPTPPDAVLLTEAVLHLFQDLAEDERPVIELSLQGYSAQEISQELGRAERSVRRLRERVRKRLERLARQGD